MCAFGTVGVLHFFVRLFSLAAAFILRHGVALVGREKVHHRVS
jgi:hypothetical protein